MAGKSDGIIKAVIVLVNAIFLVFSLGQGYPGVSGKQQWAEMHTAVSFCAQLSLLRWYGSNFTQNG